MKLLLVIIKKKMWNKTFEFFWKYENHDGLGLLLLDVELMMINLVFTTR